MALPNNICLAPFIFTTINASGQQSPCPTLGGDHWDFGCRSMKDRWLSSELTEFRQDMLDNKQLLPTCARCWTEESAGGYSLRKFIYNPESDPEGVDTPLLGSPITPKIAIKENFYKHGPMQIVMKANNICNLRCRTCNSNDSYLYKIEGNFYQEKYKVIEPIYTRGPDAVQWTDEQLDEIYEFSGNLRRLEIYGGEPLLDEQTPKLLKRLVESGRSKRIELNISTNATTLPNQEWVDTVKQFKRFNLNLSIDGVGKRFEYLRFPAKWKTVSENMDWFHNEMRSQLASAGNFSLLPIITVSTLNIWYLPELYLELTRRLGNQPHLNLVRKPWYYRIDNMPDGVKQEIVDKFKQYPNIEKLNSYINFINATPMDPELWRQFKFWTRAKDEYRKESFKDSLPEFYEIIKRHDDEF